jgi:type I restriction enzyme S subunit
MEESSNQAVSYDRFQICHSGDLVLNKYKAHLGVFWAAERRGLITPNYTVFRPAQALLTKYFELLFHLPAYRDAFSMTVYGVTEGMSPLYTKDFYQIAVLRPSFAEQEEIVRHVTCQTTTQNAVIERAGREIAVLREYRTRLVADVVTGKLDVREAAANLPEEAEEHEGPETEAPEELEEANEEALGSEDAEGQE